MLDVVVSLMLLVSIGTKDLTVECADATCVDDAVTVAEEDPRTARIRVLDIDSGTLIIDEWLQ